MAIGIPSNSINITVSITETNTTGIPSNSINTTVSITETDTTGISSYISNTSVCITETDAIGTSSYITNTTICITETDTPTDTPFPQSTLTRAHTRAHAHTHTLPPFLSHIIHIALHHHHHHQQQQSTLTRVPGDLEDPLQEVADIGGFVVHFSQLVKDGPVRRRLLELVVGEIAGAAAHAPLVVQNLVEETNDWLSETRSDNYVTSCLSPTEHGSVCGFRKAFDTSSVMN